VTWTSLVTVGKEYIIAGERKSGEKNPGRSLVA